MAINDLDQTSPARKATVLMVLLGPDTAGQLLSNLPRETVGRITTEVTMLNEIPEELAQGVLEEYFVDVLRPERYRGGIDAAREMLAGASIPEQEQREWLPVERVAVGCPEVFAPLIEAAPESLAGALTDEHPQTVALVLLNLMPAKAAAVLGKMSDEQRSATIQRMTALQPVEGGILDEVAASLQERLQDPPATESEELDGMSRTAAVLQEMSRSDIRTMLDEVEKVDEEKAQMLRAMVNTFDMLVLANDRGIQELLRGVETKTLVLALKDEEPALLNKFLSNLSERAASMFREELEYLTEVRENDKKNAQNEIMATALELERDDKLTFQEPSGNP